MLCKNQICKERGFNSCKQQIEVAKMLSSNIIRMMDSKQFGEQERKKKRNRLEIHSLPRPSIQPRCALFVCLFCETKRERRRKKNWIK